MPWYFSCWLGYICIFRTDSYQKKNPEKDSTFQKEAMIAKGMSSTKQVLPSTHTPFPDFFFPTMFWLFQRFVNRTEFAERSAGLSFFSPYEIKLQMPAGRNLK